ncbi:MAG TPA: alpha/beta fold hydrolase, partial [Longimicrobium sp.]|nr:alpha/beta fold hydrolase [Longimicrobium sp.]
MRGAVVLWLAALLALPAAAREGPLLKSVFHRRVTAPDGTALALYRYVPDGGGGGRPAVLLVPEVGFGRIAYDFAGSGLARYLQERGRDVFVAELRGQGQAQSPRGWSLGQWISLDLPAVLDAVSAAHPGPVDVVVHGYSGGLVLAACAVELKGRVRRVVALSPVVLPEVPNATVAKLLREGGALGRLARERAADFELLFTRGGRISEGEVSRLRSRVTDLSPVASRELLGWMERGDLPLPDGSTFSRRLPLYDRPT